mmetsp:Transcript_25014/g.59905  ORF Transcript_25014/g.59905 Transcript_25014/m.59905 type:complete len:328 (+) Transcript_25014:56-1039(+)|eukprot:scaffold20885_cov58-Phaeocystis_antarctica.AAC.4
MSADRCNGVQHNVYLRHAYKPDNVTGYSEYVRNLSWARNPSDVPRVAQRSETGRPFGNNSNERSNFSSNTRRSATPLGGDAQLSASNRSFGQSASGFGQSASNRSFGQSASGRSFGQSARAAAPKQSFAAKDQYSTAGYNPLHPHIHNVVNVNYTLNGSPRKFRPTMSSQSAQQRSTGPSAASPFPALNFSDQLPRTYRPVHTPGSARAGTPLSRSASESNADAYFQGGKLKTAVSVYDQALAERPNDIWVLTKRCAALCHTGAYQRAYADAQALCNIAPSAAARMRLNAIGKYMDSVWGRANACTGHETAHITLLQLVTPHTFKQW